MKLNAKSIALMSMLITLSVVSRIALIIIPNVQATTVVIILSSFILNPVGAVIVAVGSVLVSNLILGMGIWTLWQILAWSLIGLASGLVGKYHKKLPLIIIALYAGLCGLAFGFLISIPMIPMIGSVTGFWIYYLAGLPFDIAHAIGNTIFMYLLYPVFFKIINKHKRL